MVTRTCLVTVYVHSTCYNFLITFELKSVINPDIERHTALNIYMFHEGLSRSKQVQLEFMWVLMNVFVSVKVFHLPTDAQENCFNPWVTNVIYIWSTYS